MLRKGGGSYHLLGVCSSPMTVTLINGPERVSLGHLFLTSRVILFVVEDSCTIFDPLLGGGKKLKAISVCKIKKEHSPLQAATLKKKKRC